MAVELLNLEKGLLELLEDGEMTEEDILRQVKGLLDGLEGVGYLHALIDGFCHHHDSRFHGKRYFDMTARRARAAW